MNNFIRLIKQKKTIILFVVIVGLATTIFFAFRFFTPFGATIKYQFNSILDKDKLSKIKGAEETTSFSPSQTGVLQIPQQIIRQSVVTFNLKLITKPIEGVWVNLRFKGNPKEIKIGVRGSEKEKYQYLPLYNQILNLLVWNQTSEGKTTFWQREKKYQDLAGLISNPPVSDDTKVASYFFNTSDIVIKESGSSSQSNLKIEKTLRGTHTLLIKVDKKPLLLTVVKQDANAYKGEDSLSVQIFHNQNKIAEQLIPDDGVTDVGGLAMTPQKSEIKINDVKPGIYRIVLKDMTENADTRIKLIEINQSSLVSNHFFTLDEKPVTLWTNSKKITVSTPHTVGIQTIKLDSKYDLRIEKEGNEFAFDLNNPESKNATPASGNVSTLHKLEIPKNDLSISGDGYFAFSKESFFDPEPIKTIDLSQVTDLDKIDYIIANYQPVKKDGEWYVAQAYFDSTDIKVDGDKLYFSLESPELNNYGGEIVIDSLEVTVKKPGWFSGVAGQKAGETVNTLQKNEGKPNIFTKFRNGAVSTKNKIVIVLENTWQKIKGFVIGIFKKPAIKKETTTPSPTPSKTTAPTKTPTTTPTLKSSPTPTATSSTTTITSLVRVLNGGAEVGAAASVSATLKSNGFTNVQAENADKSDYKGVTINYRKDDIKTAEKIESLLKKDYGAVTKTVVSTSTAEIVAILGKK